MLSEETLEALKVEVNNQYDLIAGNNKTIEDYKKNYEKISTLENEQENAREYIKDLEDVILENDPNYIPSYTGMKGE